MKQLETIRNRVGEERMVSMDDWGSNARSLPHVTLANSPWASLPGSPGSTRTSRATTSLGGPHHERPGVVVAAVLRSAQGHWLSTGRKRYHHDTSRQIQQLEAYVHPASPADLLFYWLVVSVRFGCFAQMAATFVCARR